MKIEEAMRTLQPGQRVKSLKTGNTYEMFYSQLHIVLDNKRHYEPCPLNKDFFEADFELIPQSVPFEEALKALREGKTICCEYDKKLKYNPHWSGEIVGVTIAPDSPNYMLDTDMMLNGKWWVK